jgi:two-component system, OmpR family, response regulator VicR
MPKRILIIDDDPDILEILNIIFKQEGYEVFLSKTGYEADNLKDINPDLVLLDIMISTSGRNGSTICAKIKSSPATRNLPVIIVSAEDNIQELSKKCGANGYVSKPFHFNELIGKIHELLAA